MGTFIPSNESSRFMWISMLLCSCGFSFTMDNRHSPSRQVETDTRRRDTQSTIAHQEARDLESFIMEKRSHFLNITRNSNETIPSEKRNSFPRFDWEKEDDSEWQSPFLPQHAWVELPSNQKYDRRTWFSTFNDSEIEALMHKGRKMHFVFALSTGKFQNIIPQSFVLEVVMPE
jgi:hypothetical protein